MWFMEFDPGPKFVSHWPGWATNFQNLTTPLVLGREADSWAQFCACLMSQKKIPKEVQYFSRHSLLSSMYLLHYYRPPTKLQEGIITARKRSLQRLCFYTCLSFILFTGGGVGIPACNGPTVYKQLH